MIQYVNVRVLKTPITERYCRVGDNAQLDKVSNKIRCNGVWFDFDSRWEIENI